MVIPADVSEPNPTLVLPEEQQNLSVEHEMVLRGTGSCPLIWVESISRMSVEDVGVNALNSQCFA